MPDGREFVQETANSGNAADRGAEERNGGRGQPRRTSTSGSARAEEMASRLGDDGSSDCVDMVPGALIPPQSKCSTGGEIWNSDRFGSLLADCSDKNRVRHADVVDDNS